MKKVIVILGFLCCILLIDNAYASETTISVGHVVSKQCDTIDVPISISGNSGISGAVIKIKYDEKLTLTNVKKGDAFSSMVFTPPADMNQNPCTLLWDGLEADNTNGTIAVLTFSAPDTNDVIYGVYADYDDGGIYDGNLNDVHVFLRDGLVEIDKPKVKAISVTPPDKLIYMVGEAFDKTGMTVRLEYDDGSSKDVDISDSNLRIEGFDSSHPVDAQTITVMYGANAACFDVSIVGINECLTNTQLERFNGKSLLKVYMNKPILNGVIVVATYNGDGLLLSVSTTECKGADSYIIEDNSITDDCSVIKVFVWDDIKLIEPLGIEETLYIE